jgi:hypothetical protein
LSFLLFVAQQCGGVMLFSALIVKNAVQIKELLLYANYDSHLCGFFILRFFARIERISYLDAFYPTWSRK